jgi:hypothetical protein
MPLTAAYGSDDGSAFWIEHFDLLLLKDAFQRLDAIGPRSRLPGR